METVFVFLIVVCILVWAIYLSGLFKQRSNIPKSLYVKSSKNEPNAFCIVGDAEIVQQIMNIICNPTRNGYEAFYENINNPNPLKDRPWLKATLQIVNKHDFEEAKRCLAELPAGGPVEITEMYIPIQAKENTITVNHDNNFYFSGSTNAATMTFNQMVDKNRNRKCRSPRRN